jgi:hypothetical protein
VSPQGLHLYQFPHQQVGLRALLGFPLSGPAFHELLGSEGGRPFAFGPEQILEEGFLVSDDALLVIDLLLVLVEPLPAHPALFVLNLPGNHIA